MNHWLNYHHLYYFWRIAKLGSISAASRQLRLSQSTLSEQLKELEETFGKSLFERSGKRLEMTEPGKIALEYAEGIFTAGEELMDRMHNSGQLARRRQFRMGTLNALSKNLQIQLLKPLLPRPEIHLVVIEASMPSLIRELNEHRLDLIISNTPARTDLEPQLQNQLLGQLPVCLVGTPAFQRYRKRFPKSLQGAPLHLPTHTSRLRADLSLYFQRNQIEPIVQSEIEDMALLRLFALQGTGMVAVPEIVVSRELEAGTLKKIHTFSEVTESIYAITRSRKFPSPETQLVLQPFIDWLSSPKSKRKLTSQSVGR